MNKKLYHFIFSVFILFFAPLLPYNNLHANAAPPRFVDNAKLIKSSSEAEKLTDKLNEISARQQCEIVIVTVKTLEGKTPMDYADDYFDYNGYGFGEDKSGVLLLVSMENRDWYVSTTGYGIIAITDAGLIIFLLNFFRI